MLTRQLIKRASAGFWAAVLMLASFATLAMGAAEGDDPRTRTVLDYDCRSELSRWAVTLFANGTIRLRTVGLGERRVRLSELGPAELDAFLNRLKGEDLSETDSSTRSPEGEWVEKCTLELRLPGRAASTFIVDRYGSPSLALSRLVTIARELGERVEKENMNERQLPPEYAPTLGDILERRDGGLFRVAGFSADKGTVELAGVDGVLVLYLSRDELRHQFVALVERRSKMRPR